MTTFTQGVIRNIVDNSYVKELGDFYIYNLDPEDDQERLARMASSTLNLITIDHDGCPKTDSVAVKWGGAIVLDDVFEATTTSVGNHAPAVTELTYSFAITTSFYGYTGADGEAQTGLPTAFQLKQIAAAKRAMASYEAVSNLKFTEVAEVNSLDEISAGDIRWSNTRSGTVSTAHAYIPDPDAGVMAGDIWFGPKYPSFKTPTVGGYGYHAYIHELGHALGLIHPHEGISPAAGGEDQLKYSIMSYRAYEGQSIEGGYDADFYPTTLMLNDILAIQYLYGVNEDYNNIDNPDTTEVDERNTVYKWAGSKRIYETIWDGGGNDTLSAEGQQKGCVLRLTSGEWSEIGVHFWNGQAMVRDCLTIAYGCDIENAIGSSYGDTIYGNKLANVLEGRAGKDTLTGGKGDDTLKGGTGSDLYKLDFKTDTDDNDTPGDTTDDITILDLVQEELNAGIDEVESDYAEYTLTANVDNLTFIDRLDEEGEFIDMTGIGNNLQNFIKGASGDDNLSGLAGNDTIYGGVGDDILNGGDGRDMLEGGDDDDWYIVNLIKTTTGGIVMADTVKEKTCEGWDWITLEGIVSTANYSTLTLGANLEALDASETEDTKLNLTGNALQNILIGNDANNRLDGGKELDYMRGGLGDDTYVIDQQAELLKINYQVFFDRVDNMLVLTRVDDPGIDTIVVRYSNPDTKHAKAVVLDYWIDEDGVVHHNLDSIENVTVTGTGRIDVRGNDLGNKLTGNDSANVLDGNMGADRLEGKGGNDTYVVEDIGDVVIEAAGKGTDTVQSWIDYDLRNTDGAGGCNVENLTLLDLYVFDHDLDDYVLVEADLNGTGNALNNVMTGNSSDNLLTGLDGNDTMIGLLGIDTLAGGNGDDTYIVDEAGEIVIELAGQGTDTVKSSITYGLNDTDGEGGSNVENLTLTGNAAIDGTGNAAGNVLTGNGAANVLDGGAGADTMLGGGGNDIYLVDDIGDQVVETTTVTGTADAGGTDIVLAKVDWVLSKFVEELRLEGSAVNGAGSDLNNIILGNGVDNVLSGGAGVDVLYGSAGNDTLRGGAGSDDLNGGTGDDIFVFNTTLSATKNVDRLLDFKTNGYADKINLENLIFTRLTKTGELDARYFVSEAGAVAHDGNDHILYDSASGDLFYDADGNGAGAAVKFAYLTGAPMISAADFAVI